jgi:hypothetical protein
MINEEELKISNKSYVNKDFQKLYPEILDLARKLSSKWDPSTSNESDPGVVLLKMLGFMGDKLNYNIDKNILEAFMPSATQETSMRNLCEINGYFPRYFRSATTDISFMYTGDKLDGIEDSFKLSALETTITDVDGLTTYTLLGDAVISSKFTTVTVPAIEGRLEALLVSNSPEIHLSNLDDNNRIYFTERQVAENGVFVRKITDFGNFWRRVDNLNTIEPGQLVYKFGFDSTKNLPYLEFPSDIAGIISEGLIINYIRTTGAAGNVRRGFLTRLSSPTEITLTANQNVVVFPDISNNESERGVLKINNLSSSSNGEDPESIEEAYNSFKKVVGTFDTLVTSRDYANAIYNLQTQDSKDVVSNVQVADRRTDINYSNLISSFNQFGPVKLNLTLNEDITPFNLCLYPLNPIITSFNLETYRSSFLPLTDLTDVLSGIEENKTISHDYKTLQDNDIYLYKNYYQLGARISTNNKVNSFEQESILRNINEALFKKFNSREIDYGFEIPFDTLLKTIQEADTRIKNVALDEPILTAKVMTKDKTETLLLDETNKEKYIELLGKNILAGRASLFDYKEDFSFEFGQTAINLSTEENPSEEDFIHEKLVKMTTEVTIPKEDIVSINGYTLKENEYVQAIAPSLATEITYPAFVNYRWEGLSVPDGSEHSITGPDSLTVNYVDSNNNSIAIRYSADKVTTYRVSRDRESGQDFFTSVIISDITVPVGSNIFKPVNLSLTEPQQFNISGIVTTKKIKFGVDVKDFYSFGTEESVEKRKFVETTLTARSLPCYWIMNNKDNALFTESDALYDGNGSEAEIIGYQKVLSENEYFIYSNTALTELEVLGSGTRITLNTSGPEDLSKWKIITSESEQEIEITSVSERGLAAFESYNWKYFNFSLEDYNLKLEEMTILTLTTGDSIRLSTTESGLEAEDLTNEWYDVSNDWEINYIIEGEGEKTLPSYTGLNWRIRSRLDLNVGPTLKQKILENQTITLYLQDGLGGLKTRIFNKDNEHEEGFIKFNTLLQRSGGIDIDLEVTYLTGETAFDVVAYTFNYEEPTYIESDDKIINIDIKPSGYYQINLKNLKTTGDIAEIDLPLVSYYDSGDRVSEDGATQLIMFYWEKSDDQESSEGTQVTLLSDEEGIRKYNSNTAYDDELELTPGINIIEVNSVSLITIKVEDPQDGFDVLQISRISVTSGYNSALKLSIPEVEGSGGLLQVIRDLDTDGLFFYNGSLDSFSLIEFNDLSDPRSLFDYNNLANRFTLCQIDFEKSNIEIVRTSRI